MSASPSLVGSVLDGKYRVAHLLGRGGMGEVYAGVHLQLERAVAIKVLHGGLGADESFVQRFAREARTAARLEHPNAVHVYDFGSLEDGSAYLVMEFIEGVTLREVMRENPHFPLGVVLDLMRQACAAVAAAHARGIVHRDLKPENMMVRTDESGRAILKVVDFGLAKILENQTSQLSNQSELIGTPKYMSPEQFSGGRIDERVDVYALGCILFELLTGRAPFDGMFVEIVGKHVYAEVPTFASLGVDLAPEVETVARHALAKDPADRTPSAAELARELEVAIGADRTGAVGEQITVPLPKPAPVVVRGDDELVTRATDVLGSERDYRTQYADRTDEDESTRVRPKNARPPGVPSDAPAVDPQTRAMRPARRTAVDFTPAVSPSPARASWPLLAAVGLAAAAVVGTGSYWLATRTPVVEPPPAQTDVAAPPAPTEPRTTVTVEPEPAASTPAPAATPSPAPAPVPSPPPRTQSRPSRTEVTPEAPPVAPEPAVTPVPPPPPDMGPDVPRVERQRRLKRYLRELERQRRLRERGQPRPRP